MVNVTARGRYFCRSGGGRLLEVSLQEVRQYILQMYVATAIFYLFFVYTIVFIMFCYCFSLYAIFNILVFHELQFLSLSCYFCYEHMQHMPFHLFYMIILILFYTLWCFASSSHICCISHIWYTFLNRLQSSVTGHAVLMDIVIKVLIIQNIM